MKIQTTDPKTLLLVGLAFVVGGGAGFFIAKKLLEEHYRELSQDEINDVRAYFTEKYEEPTPKDLDNHRKLVERYAKPSPEELISKPRIRSVADIEAEEIEQGIIVETDIDDDFENNLEDEEHPEYLEEDLYSDEDEDEDDFEDPPNEEEGIAIIEYEDFRDDNGYDKIDLFFYRFDSVMCDENDTIILDPQDKLGWEWEQILERKTTCFVRNHDIGVDFEIHALSKSYNDEVSIRLETDKERQFRQLARSKEALDTLQEALDSEYEEEQPRKPKTTPYKRPKNQKINYNDIPVDVDVVDNVDIVDDTE